MNTARAKSVNLALLADAVLVILDHARATDTNYTFGPLSREELLASGLWLTGDISDVLKVLSEKVPELIFKVHSTGALAVIADD